VGCGGERRAVGKTGLGSLQYIPMRSAEPQDRSQGPLGARYAPRQTLPNPRLGRGGKGLTDICPRLVCLSLSLSLPPSLSQSKVRRLSSLRLGACSPRDAEQLRGLRMLPREGFGSCHSRNPITRACTAFAAAGP